MRVHFSEYPPQENREKSETRSAGCAVSLGHVTETSENAALRGGVTSGDMDLESHVTALFVNDLADVPARVTSDMALSEFSYEKLKIKENTRCIHMVRDKR